MTHAPQILSGLPLKSLSKLKSSGLCDLYTAALDGSIKSNPQGHGSLRHMQSQSVHVQADPDNYERSLAAQLTWEKPLGGLS